MNHILRCDSSRVWSFLRDSPLLRRLLSPTTIGQQLIHFLSPFLSLLTYFVITTLITSFPFYLLTLLRYQRSCIVVASFSMCRIFLSVLIAVNFLWKTNAATSQDFAIIFDGCGDDSKCLRERYRKASLQFHPDHIGGNKDDFIALRRSYEEYLEKKPTTSSSSSGKGEYYDFKCATTGSAANQSSLPGTNLEVHSTQFVKVHVESFSKFQQNLSSLAQETIPMTTFPQNRTIQDFDMFFDLVQEDSSIKKLDPWLLTATAERISLFKEMTISHWQFRSNGDLAMIKSWIQTITSAIQLKPLYDGYQQMYRSKTQSLHDECQTSDLDPSYITYCNTTRNVVKRLERTLPALCYWIRYADSVAWDVEDEVDAEFLRRRGYTTLDWIPTVGSRSFGMMVNSYLLAGLYFQAAANIQFSTNPTEYQPIVGADSNLALVCYGIAMQLSQKGSPDVQLRTSWYVGQVLQEASYMPDRTPIYLQARQTVFRILDFYPLYPKLTSIHEEVVDPGTPSLLDHMRRITDVRLQSLIAIADDDTPLNDGPSASVVYYQAYYGVWQGWYKPVNITADTIRSKLMLHLLYDDEGVDVDEITAVLLPVNHMINLDQDGWYRGERMFFPDREVVYAALLGFKINYNTGTCELALQKADGDDGLFSQIDLVAVFGTPHDHAFVSLEQPINSSSMEYHPFQRLIFHPANIPNDYRHAMFHADYTLKFLTTGYEIQYFYPFAIQRIDALLAIIQKTSPSLADAIRTYHKTSKAGKAHRFWIEALKVPTHIDQEEDGVLTYGYGKASMRIRKHLLKRNSDGELTDDDNDKEGWPVYVLTPSQIEGIVASTHALNESRALVISTANSTVRYFESTLLSEQSFEMPSKLVDGLIPLLENGGHVSSTGKFHKNATSESWLYMFTINITATMGKPSFFSPERILAEELTANFGDLAQALPEFGRVQAFSTMTLARSNVLKHAMDANETISKYNSFLIEFPEDVKQQLRGKVNESSFGYWQRLYYNITADIDDEAIHNISHHRAQDLYAAVALTINEHDASLAAKADEVRNGMRENAHVASWDQVHHGVRELVEKKIAEQTATARELLFENLRNQVREVYLDLGALMDANRFHQIVMDFVDGNIETLISAVMEFMTSTIHSQLVANGRDAYTKSLLEVFGVGSEIAVEKYLNGEIQPLVDLDTSKKLPLVIEQQREYWTAAVASRTILLQQMEGMGITLSAPEANVDRPSFAWVPASSSYGQNMSNGQSNNRRVYGGVLLRAVNDLKRDASFQLSSIRSSAPFRFQFLDYNDFQFNRASMRLTEEKRKAERYDWISPSEVRSTISHLEWSYERAKRDAEWKYESEQWHARMQSAIAFNSANHMYYSPIASLAPPTSGLPPTPPPTSGPPPSPPPSPGSPPTPPPPSGSPPTRPPTNGPPPSGSPPSAPPSDFVGPLPSPLSVRQSWVSTESGGDVMKLNVVQVYVARRPLADTPITGLGPFAHSGIFAFLENGQIALIEYMADSRVYVRQVNSLTPTQDFMGRPRWKVNTGLSDVDNYLWSSQQRGYSVSDRRTVADVTTMMQMNADQRGKFHTVNNNCHKAQFDTINQLIGQEREKVGWYGIKWGG